VNRHSVASWIGLGGAALGVGAGLLQAVAGAGLSEWTGDKIATGALGTLTIVVSLLAGVAAWRARAAERSILGRAGCAVVMIVAALLILTTVGRAAYLPTALLVIGGLLAVDEWRTTRRSVAEHWGRVLVSALGCSILLAVAAGPAIVTVLGAFCGVGLIVAPWLLRPADDTGAGVT
jgi:hypothetical protein